MCCNLIPTDFPLGGEELFVIFLLIIMNITVLFEWLPGVSDGQGRVGRALKSFIPGIYCRLSTVKETFSKRFAHIDVRCLSMWVSRLVISGQDQDQAEERRFFDH
jgi:hypothetical protein